MNTTKSLAISNGQTALGIEFGSTRVKATLIDENCQTIASGSYEWENQLVDNIWTYDMSEVVRALQASYADLVKNVEAEYGVLLTQVRSIGISGMMHGYLARDKNQELLVPFRTWRNTITQAASEKITQLFQVNIPQRWSIAHLYQAMINEETHIPQLASLTTLAGHVHQIITGEFVLGIGEASGMFPVDCTTNDYRQDLVEKFDELLMQHNLTVRLREILPKAIVAGDIAGYLTPAGAKLLDPAGNLQAGIACCPPESDAGTGMVATNSITPRSGNVSVGTSIFAMVVLDKPLKHLHEELDPVATPMGADVAMVHCNNCTSDLNSWMRLFAQVVKAVDAEVTEGQLYQALLNTALTAQNDGGGLLNYNYLSGEHITEFEQGRPIFVRPPNAEFSLGNFMRVQLMSAFATLHLGMQVLRSEEVAIDSLFAHGGLFKTPLVAQSILAAAIATAIEVSDTASEGGSWGMAVLARYLWEDKDKISLLEFLAQKVFADMPTKRVEPDASQVAGFARFINQYKAGLAVERQAVQSVSQ